MQYYKTIFLIFAFFLFNVQLHAQDSNKQKVDILYQKAFELQSKNGDSIKNIANDILSISTRSKYEFGVIQAKLLASIYYINNMRLDTAGVLLNDCETFFTSNGRQVTTVEGGYCFFLQGERAFRLRNFDIAESYANKALVVFEEVKSDKNLAITFTQLGTINLLQENRPKALDYYLKALKFKMQLGTDPKLYRSETKNIAEIYKSMGEYEKALHYNRISLNSSTSDRLRSEDFRAIGNIFADQKMIDSAFYYYNKAKQLSTNFDDKSYQKVLNFNIAQVFSIDNKFVESNRILVPFLKEGFSPHSTMETNVKIQIARNYIGLKKYDSAVYYARMAFKTANNRNNRSEIIRASEILLDAFKALARYDSAFHYSMVYHLNKDSIYSMENQRKLSSLYAEIETLSKQKEIETLEKQNLIDQVKNRNLMLAIVLGSVSFLFLLISVVLFYRNKQKRQILDNLILQQEIESRNKDLHNQALKMIYMNNSFMEIEESLKRIHLQSSDSAKDIRQLLSNLQLNKTLEKEWDNFNRYFGTVHGNFFSKINADFPELSTSEKRLASLIRMNLTNREIASILNIESASVKIAKYRLKKKLNLNEEIDIHSFFQSMS